MENENIKVIMGDKEKAELIIRKVDTANELPVKPPVNVDIKGTLEAPFSFLSKRYDQPDQIEQKHCLILVDREKMTITLITHENDAYKQGKVVGTLEVYPKFEEFGINSGKVWSPTELGLFIKMNRAFFKQKEENMRLVTELMNFKGKVDSVIEKSLKEKGDRTDNFSQVVNSNLPEKFNINIPIMKGYQAEDIEVETFAQINGREVSFVLISPGAQETMELTRNEAIDAVIKLINGITPDIAIIEV